MEYLDDGRKYVGNEPEIQSPIMASEDHVYSASGGGTRHQSNVVVAHRQCNSLKGKTEPNEAMLEKLRLLNIKRGFAAPGQPGTLQADSFSLKSQALDVLIIRINNIEGPEGVKIRRRVARMISNAEKILKNLKDVKSKGVRDRAATLMIQEMIPIHIPMDDVSKSHLENVLRTMLRCFKE